MGASLEAPGSHFQKKKNCFFFFGFLGSHPQHIEVSQARVKSELQLPAYTIATVMRDLSHVCDFHHSSRQYWIPDPLREARDGTHNLMASSQIHFCCTTMGTPHIKINSRAPSLEKVLK